MFARLGKTVTSAIGRFRPVSRPSHFASTVNAMDMFASRLKAEQIARKFQLSNEQLQDVACGMAIATNAGLRSAVPDSSLVTVKCWDTRVDFPPPKPAARSAVDRYLSLELAHGKYFRTRLTNVSDPHDVHRDSETHQLPQCLKTGSVRSLFDHLSSRLAEFADRHNVRTTGLPLTFTFGFPVRQTALDEAVSYRWTKEFDCSTAEVAGRNVVDELRSSLRRSHVEVGPVALLNDACALMLDNQSVQIAPDQSVRVSVVVDDGCNCCYAERVENVKNRRKATGPVSGTRHTIVNTEWGGFGEDGVLDRILTEFDRRLDGRSVCPGKQIFEKMTSSLYMTELVRELVLEMTREKVLFDGRITSAMSTAGALKLEHLCAVESDPRAKFDAGRDVLTRTLGVTDPSEFDCSLFRYVCECVTKRSAHLVSAGLSSVLQRLRPALGFGLIARVAVGGSVFDTHAEYKTMVTRKTSELTDMTVALQTNNYEHGAPFVAELLTRMLSSTVDSKPPGTCSDQIPPLPKV